MQATARIGSKRYLPYVFLATFLVAVFPVLMVGRLRGLGVLRWGLLSPVMAAVLSIAIARLGSAAWMRWRGSSDYVFGDLMLWGWIRRMRSEKRLTKAAAMLGLDRPGPGVLKTDLSPKEQIEALQALAHALESNDAYTSGHSRRVTRHAIMIAKTMSLPEEVIIKLRTAAAVHDVGKIFVPKELLNKPGRLTEAEFEIIKQHAPKGGEIVESLGDSEITAFVRHHHERLDGKGYPDGLSGDNIPLGARIIAVADTFDAITSTRAYRPAASHRKAIEVLKKEAGAQLDGEAVAAFLKYYSGRNSFGWWASLTTLPQRLPGWFLEWLGGGVTKAGQTAVALTTAVAVGTVAPQGLPALANMFGQDPVAQSSVVARSDDSLESADSTAIAAPLDTSETSEPSLTKPAPEQSDSPSADSPPAGDEVSPPPSGDTTPSDESPPSTDTTPSDDPAPKEGTTGIPLLDEVLELLGL